MRRAEAMQGVRMIKLRSVFERYDRRLGQASGKRVPAEREQQIETLCRTRYSGFTAKHFHEHRVRDHGFTWGYTWTTVFLQSKGLLTRAKTRGVHRRKRPRRPSPGMMLHQSLPPGLDPGDGSRHERIAGFDATDLIVTMDVRWIASLRHRLGEPLGSCLRPAQGQAWRSWGWGILRPNPPGARPVGVTVGTPAFAGQCMQEERRNTRWATTTPRCFTNSGYRSRPVCCARTLSGPP
jgi:hypothetical protein